MSKAVNNIITIRKENISLANEAFAELMRKTEHILNSESKENPQKYKTISATQLETISLNTLKKACSDTPFNPDNIELVSGQSFPDIVADRYYGVEVKSTTKNHWMSTGSSMVESTRHEDVENIYMLFGKLGGNPPEFKCRPYQDVLYDIAVTHSPRYLINMELAEGHSIFAKMHTSYDELRTSSDSINRVRRYYREKALLEKKDEMPWWLTSEMEEQAMPFNIRMWNSLSGTERKILLAKCLILFPEILSPVRNAKKYNQATLWLCSYCQVVMPNIRDVFTAGGKIVSVDDKDLDVPVAQIFKTIVDNAGMVKSLLESGEEDMIALIKEFNPELLNGGLYDNWLRCCMGIADSYRVPIIEWIDKKPKFRLSK